MKFRYELIKVNTATVNARVSLQPQWLPQSFDAVCFHVAAVSPVLTVLKAYFGLCTLPPGTVCYLCMVTCVSWHACGGQRTTVEVGFLPPPYGSWGSN